MGKAGEPKTIEEYVRGPDGEGEQGLIGAIQRAITEAASRSTEEIKVDQVFVTCRTTPSVGGPSVLAFSTRFTLVTPINTIADRLLAQLEGNPGGAFTGTIRVDFKAGTDTSTHLTSFTRTITPESFGGDESASLLPAGGSGMTDEPFRYGYRPMMDLVLQATSAQVATMNAAAQREQAAATFFGALSGGLTGMVAAIRGATPDQGGGGGLMTLLSAVTGMAQAAGVDVPKPITAGVNVARQLTANSSAPPPPSPVASTDVPPPPAPIGQTAPPTPIAPVSQPQAAGFNPATLTREQVELWAKANPTDAGNMVVEAAQKGGAPPMVVDMIKAGIAK
jgi:hypothetical protein